MILIMILILILIMILILILIMILILILIMILILILNLCSGTGGKRAQKERKKSGAKNLPRRRKRVLTKELGWCTMVVHTVIVCPFMPSPIT